MIKKYLICFASGITLTFSFAPFHMAGLAFLALIVFYNQINSCQKIRQTFWQGIFFGMGLFGSGVSWVFNSIHQYGHLNLLLSAVLTGLFVIYLAFFPGLMATCYNYLQRPTQIFDSLLFASTWTGFELLRGILFTGFPWLNIGIGQIDSPMKGWLPILGVYGVSFMVAFIAALLSSSIFPKKHQKFRPYLIIIAVIITLSGNIFKDHNEQSKKLISVAIIQKNLSMHEKWDENYFWNLLLSYEQAITAALEHDIILLPESAVPVATKHIKNWLQDLNDAAENNKATILMGAIENPANTNNYFNTLLALGKAHGHYFKKQLVPFGEYIPRIFKNLTEKLGIPDPALKSGNNNQKPIVINKNAIASFICYEIAFDNIIRQQLPFGKFIVTITDSGWFGESLAGYQLQQISQVRSLQTNRFQLVANNDGLSSLIDGHGNIIHALPRNKPGLLTGQIYAKNTVTLWAKFGNLPCEILIFGIILTAIYKKIKKKA
jgi:apolipoprotein N-acyltransferase